MHWPFEFSEKIAEQKAKLAHGAIDFRDARILKENSDEKRLQPIYIQLFFEKAFKTNNLRFELRTKGIQYFLPMGAWKDKLGNV